MATIHQTQSGVDETKFGCGHLEGSIECERQFHLGQDAGWRNDEIVVPKLACYQAGYTYGREQRLMTRGDRDARQAEDRARDRVSDAPGAHR